jgi:hypothetical protein
MLLEHLGHLASKRFGCPVQRTKSVQNAGECPLFLKPHSATRTTLQMCTETFQFLTAEFIVEIMQNVNSIIAGVHSEAARALIVRTSQSRTPSIQDYSLDTDTAFLAERHVQIAAIARWSAISWSGPASRLWAARYLPTALAVSAWHAGLVRIAAASANSRTNSLCN